MEGSPTGGVVPLFFVAAPTRTRCAGAPRQQIWEGHKLSSPAPPAGFEPRPAVRTMVAFSSCRHTLRVVSILN